MALHIKHAALITPLLITSLLPTILLTACSEPPAETSNNITTPPAVEKNTAIYAVVYRCNDGSVFTVFPNGERAQADFTAQKTPENPPTAIAECEGIEAASAAEAEKLRANPTQPATPSASPSA